MSALPSLALAEGAAEYQSKSIVHGGTKGPPMFALLLLLLPLAGPAAGRRRAREGIMMRTGKLLAKHACLAAERRSWRLPAIQQRPLGVLEKSAQEGLRSDYGRHPLFRCRGQKVGDGGEEGRQPWWRISPHCTAASAIHATHTLPLTHIYIYIYIYTHMHAQWPV